MTAVSTGWAPAAVTRETLPLAGLDAVVRSVVDTGNMLIETGKYGFAVLIAATCASPSASSFLTRRMTTTGLVAAAILVLSTVPPFLTNHGIG